MYEVTCVHCHRAVDITPDASACPACGEELQQLLLPDQVADYFLARVQTLAGDSAAALAAVERGLAMCPSSHLRLTAAILAEQVGRFDRMRRHVAAIPVDDALRGEAEWLLRSHRAHGARVRTQRQPPVPPSTFLDDLLGRGQDTDTASRRSRLPGLIPLVTVMVVTGLAVWVWAARDNLVMPELPHADAPEGPMVTFAPAQAPDDAAAAPMTVVNLLPTPTPAPEIPPHLVVTHDESAETADADPRQVVVIRTTGFDLPAYLRENGYPRYAQLAVSARLQGDTLILQGIVHEDRQRRDLIRLAQDIPGVSEVNAIDLLLRPLPVYEVQTGDTLWTIVAGIYGDVTRMDEFIVHNRDVLPSPDSLVPGMELKVPPIR